MLSQVLTTLIDIAVKPYLMRLITDICGSSLGESEEVYHFLDVTLTFLSTNFMLMPFILELFDGLQYFFSH